MVDVGFYKGLASLGDKVVKKYKAKEEILVYVMGQVARHGITRDGFFNKEKTVFIDDLLKLADRSGDSPTESNIEQFSQAIKIINHSLVGFSTNYKMTVASLLLKLFFQD